MLFGRLVFRQSLFSSPIVKCDAIRHIFLNLNGVLRDPITARLFLLGNFGTVSIGFTIGLSESPDRNLISDDFNDRLLKINPVWGC